MDQAMHMLRRTSEQACDSFEADSFVMEASSGLVLPYLERPRIKRADVSTFE